MNKLIYNSLHNQSGFVLPLLMIVSVIAFGAFTYFYFQSSDSSKLDVLRKVEEKVSKQTNTDDRIKIPAEVAITKNGFMPATISIVAGQQVTFVNKDKNIHRVIPSTATTRNALPELDSEDLQPTDTFTYSFEKSGTFIVRNGINSGKYQATIIVN